jgi:hypothetical protein
MTVRFFEAVVLVRGVVFGSSSGNSQRTWRDLTAKAPLYKLGSLNTEEHQELCEFPKAHEKDGEQRKGKRMKRGNRVAKRARDARKTAARIRKKTDHLSKLPAEILYMSNNILPRVAPARQNTHSRYRFSPHYGQIHNTVSHFMPFADTDFSNYLGNC